MWETSLSGLGALAPVGDRTTLALQQAAALLDREELAATAPRVRQDRLVLAAAAPGTPMLLEL
jgi:hypothetical protein